MQYFGFDRPSFGFKTYGFGSNPDAAILALFAGGKQGVFYDPSDLTTLFQDVSGTIPVTKDGDPVGLIKDKSGNGNHATQTVSTARPIYRTDGILHSLEFDGIDDYFMTAYTHTETQTLMCAVSVPQSTSTNTIFGGRHRNDFRSFFALNTQKIYVGVGSTYQSGVNAEALVTGQTYVLGFKYFKEPNGLIYTYTGKTISGSTDWIGTTQPTTNSFLGAMNNAGSANFMFEGAISGLFVISAEIDVTDIAKYLANKAGVTL